MYRYKQKKGKKKERSVKTSLYSPALHNARTFKLLSLRVRCIRRFFFAYFIVLLLCSTMVLYKNSTSSLPLKVANRPSRSLARYRISTTVTVR